MESGSVEEVLKNRFQAHLNLDLAFLLDICNNVDSQENQDGHFFRKFFQAIRSDWWQRPGSLSLAQRFFLSCFQRTLFLGF